MRAHSKPKKDKKVREKISTRSQVITLIAILVLLMALLLLYPFSKTGKASEAFLTDGCFIMVKTERSSYFYRVSDSADECASFSSALNQGKSELIKSLRDSGLSIADSQIIENEISIFYISNNVKKPLL